jgi:antitoxin (DNA-binding transcriptional repressor) of toxin-antitoxin stability system
MKTLTITDAKKNLGRWLAAASRGEDVGIVCEADIIALRKVEVESRITHSANTERRQSNWQPSKKPRTNVTGHSSDLENSSPSRLNSSGK